MAVSHTEVSTNEPPRVDSSQDSSPDSSLREPPWFREYVARNILGYTPQEISTLSGIPLSTTEELSQTYAQAIDIALAVDTSTRPSPLTQTYLSERTGLDLITLRLYAHWKQRELPPTRPVERAPFVTNNNAPRRKKNKSHEKSLQSITNCLEKGIVSLEDISTRTKLASSTVFTYAQQLPLHLKEKLSFNSKDRYKLQDARQRKGIDELVLLGLPQTTIAVALGTMRERARQYIHGRGLREQWEQAQRTVAAHQYSFQCSSLRDATELRSSRGQVAPLIELHTYLAIARNDPTRSFHEQAYREAIASVHSNDRGRPKKKTFEQFYTLFHEYYTAREQGIPVTNREFSSRSGITEQDVGRLLRARHLPLLAYGQRKRRECIPKHLKEVLRRGYSTILSTRDLSHFTGLYDWSAHSYYADLREQGVVPPERHTSMISLEYGTSVTFREASEILEAVDDTRFTREGISELVNRSRSTIDGVIADRESIEQLITANLSILYPDRTETKPYLTTEERVKYWKIAPPPQ